MHKRNGNTERNVESICYEETHIQSVLSAIRENFENYFRGFIETHAGMTLSVEQFGKLRQSMGVQKTPGLLKKDPTARYKSIILESITAFEHDRVAYEQILDMDALEEYEEDPNTFKTRILGAQCPVIRRTLANRKAKELDKYRLDFRRSNPDGLLNVVTRLCTFAEEYIATTYDASTYELCKHYHDLHLELLDTADYTYFGVIGGGIKTMMLYKLNPMVFPSRSRNAVWALWFLSGKQDFGCRMGSEFLMIDVQKVITQQNYFYPYTLFAFYAFEIYKMLRDKASDLGVYIDPAYRYVIVDAFFDYVASEHLSEIRLLSKQLYEEEYYCA